MAFHLPITDACNLNCVFCSAEKRDGRFALPRLLALIDQDRTDSVQISGGEPLARDPAELLAILLHCRNRGKAVELQTNGTLVEGYDLKKLKLIAGLVAFFNVNFPAHTPELEAAVTGEAAALGRRARGVRRLFELGGVVRLSHVLCEANYRHCEDFVRFARRELAGFSWVQFSHCKAAGRAKGNPKVLPRFQDAAPYLLRACRLCDELEIRFDIDHIPLCFVPEYKERHVDYGKMRGGAPGAHLAEKRRVGRCAACPLRGDCPGPRRDYVELYGEL
jgi:MoaA/NifB/PqqE/SkfB family radical SAM enzyme